MSTKGITLISYGDFEDEFLGKITDYITSEYNLPVEIKEDKIDLNHFYDPTRRQYDGNKLLSEIQVISLDDIKTIGLFRVDIFIPILTYIFGQAFLNGQSGIVSTFRLKNELYGLKKDDNLLIERFGKVVIHELGHTFGLVHCHIPSCVMRAGSYVENLDQKTMHLCPSCRKQLNV